LDQEILTYADDDAWGIDRPAVPTSDVRPDGVLDVAAVRLELVAVEVLGQRQVRVHISVPGNAAVDLKIIFFKF